MDARPALLAVVILLAGCSQPLHPAPSGALHLKEQVRLEVIDAHVERGTCQGGIHAFDKECHVLRVRMALDKAADSPVLTAGSWSSVPPSAWGSGGRAPDFLYPGTATNVTLRFEMPEGSPTLTAIRYEGLSVYGAAAVPTYAPGLRDPEIVRLHVLAVQVEAHRCFSAKFTEKECHRLQVTVENNGTAAVDVGALSWSAKDVAGGLYDQAETSGPARVAAHGTATLTLGFDLAPAAPHLAAVQLDDAQESITVSGAVPAY